MMHGVAKTAGHNSLVESLPALIERDGSAGHRYVSSAQLNSDVDAARNLADAVHYLGILHGHNPGVVELASLKTALPEARTWLEQAEQGFGRERLFLSQLTVAAGPLPSTPGHDKSEAAVLSQRHAIETLARSERTGCALGAAMALVLDWQEIRAVLLAAAEKLDIEAPRSALPVASDTLALADTFGENPAIQRAVAFGAEQILAQHRGLWNLLEARVAARDMW
ncbi:DUF6975 family protein [Parasphingopyxis lamellibrachiae]|uniref:Uncharacterized protein n=1 Tax=Parasphingopyxis lamellibrachiae TaxID=680125 RepID=A0A3D9FCJ5_9SPHN|nr:hypothetical protein [Parasphingopyxis lamellibrachiae]RED15524.1 hypothetical protein DFR46_0519 [Parasphingopyxis lamellibrachiae]